MSESVKGTCFVVMGFGRKTDFQSGRTLDLDKTYRNVIKPAAEEAGLRCERADEIVHSGLIDVPMYERLLSADVVIADLSTANNNAFYELGVRHALRPYTTIVITEDGLLKDGAVKLPFDVNRVVVRQYHHLGEDIGFDEVMRFRKVLKEAIVAILGQNPRESDSPVYTFIEGLKPPARASTRGGGALAKSATPRVTRGGTARAAGDAGRELDKALGGTQAGEQGVGPGTHSALMQQVGDAQKAGDFDRAKELLTEVRAMRPDDPYVIQRLVIATYKSRKPTPREALEEARELLRTLRPETSNDTWTLGLWGTVHQHLWRETGDRSHLDEALRGYARGFTLRRDYYNGRQQAFILNLRASNSESPAEAIADFVLAARIRREVIPLCDEWLASTPTPSASGGGGRRELNRYLEGKYWVLATKAEAYLGSGDEPKARQFFEEAGEVIRQLSADGYPEFQLKKMRDDVRRRSDELRAMLADSPLKHLKADAG